MFVSIKLSRKLLLSVFGVICACILGVCIFSSAYTEIKHTDKKKEGVFVPIIMYHSILKDEDYAGAYVVSPVVLEKDILYLKENGYTPVFVNDLIRYVQNGESLPEKPVILTFDDGFYNNYTYLFPLLQKYDFKASISIVGDYTMNASESGEEPRPTYSYLRWKEINEMRNSGFVEFCSHSYNMHTNSDRNGVCRKTGESYNDFRKVFMQDIFKLQDMCDENCKFKPNVFTYPFGAYEESSQRLVKNCGFLASMDAEEKPNYIKKDDPECLYNLHRYNRPSGISTEDFMKKALDEG